MAGSSIKLGVDVTEFKRGMTEAQTSVKTLDAAIKTNEKSMQAYGKSESYVSTQATLLNSKLKEQEKIVQNAEKSLKAMEENGVSKSSKAYQEMYRKMLEARGAMIDTTVQINQLTTEEAGAAKGADQLANSIGGIGKKLSLDQVIGGIDKITGALEGAAKKAVSFGQALWENITEGANWADSTATGAAILGMDIEEYQRYTKVFDTVADITVKDWQNAKNKVQKAVVKPTDEQFDIFAALGVGLRDVNGTISPYYNRYVIGTARDWEDVFWDVGAKLRENVKNGKMTQDQADVYAQALFGKSWGNLNPIFEKGREAFEEELKNQNVVTEESVNKLAELNDSLVKLEGDFETLKTEMLAGLAPALQEGAKALDGVLSSIMEYLRTPGGQEALAKLGEAVSGLFADLGKIDPEKVVQGFVDVFTKVTDGIQWLVDNKETAKGILGAIVAGWGTLELTKGALEVAKLIDGIKDLTGIGAAEGAAAGASWGGAFASAVLKAAPWLVGLITLLTPSGTGNDDLVDSNGNLTEVGQQLENERITEEERLANRTDRERWLEEMSAKYNGTMGISAVNMMMFGHDPIYEKIQDYWDKYRTGTATTEDWTNLQGSMDSKKWEQFMQVAKFMYSLDSAVEDLPDEAFGFNENFEEWLKENENGMPIMIDPVIPDNAAEGISEEIGPVLVPVQLVVQELTDEEAAELFKPKANGIWRVPYDGYLARLHKNERVVPAREVSSRNFSSNLYVESMIMNNGTDAAGLAASMAAEQRRMMSGVGS